MRVMKLRNLCYCRSVGEDKAGAGKGVIDDGKDQFKTLTGTISWISDKTEFTPKDHSDKKKNIANLVYAIKVNVANNGFPEIWYVGEFQFQ